MNNKDKNSNDRIAVVDRKTKETQIKIELNVDGKGDSVVKTPIGFFTHMLEAFAKHGLFDMNVEISGDIEIDQHHTIEDTGICLGQAFKKALGDKKGINRAGYFVYPMDESLAVVAVDIGGRPLCVFDAEFKRRFCGEMDTDLVEDFFIGFSQGLGANVQVKMPYGRNDHHKIEAIFKAFTKAMKMACEINEKVKERIPSTKGMIENK
jgi:imidazoleglycerol-phosphate dehydratase